MVITSRMYCKIINYWRRFILKKFAKINRHQNKNIAVLKDSKVKNCQINSLPNCHIWKIAKYTSHQTFSFYSNQYNQWPVACWVNQWPVACWVDLLKVISLLYTILHVQLFMHNHIQEQYIWSFSICSCCCVLINQIWVE